jgi:hypothetical protein
MAAAAPVAPLRVRTVTWNVGELDGDFYETHMLIPLLLGERRADVDLVAIGLQEAEMTAGSFLAAGVSYDETEKGIKWSATFETTLATHRFVKITSCQLMGVHLSVYAREVLAATIAPGSVQLSNVGTGLGGMGFNKGGIAVRLELGGASWLFLNCHLAAGQSKASSRNSDWKKIVSRLQFEGGQKGMECTYVIVMGDMNYRIESPGLSEEELRLALEPLRSGAAAGYVPNSLLQADQLTIEKAKGNVFVGFEEEPITFAPTYKYDENTDNFDTSAKQRTPSWCDRVLWRTHESITPVRGSYNSCTSLKGSDHRPVGLDLLISCPSPFDPSLVKALETERHALQPLPTAIGVGGVGGVGGGGAGGEESSSMIMPSSFFHIAPDGSHEPYSPSDSALIAAARASGQPAVRIADVILPNGKALQFEVRFGGNAWSARIPQGCATGMLQVNLDPTSVASRVVVELPACWSGTAALTEAEDLQGTEWQMGISGHDEVEPQQPQTAAAVDGGSQAVAAVPAAAAAVGAGGGGGDLGAAEPTWMPLDRALVVSLVEFYMAGGPLYSSVVRLSAEQEVDLARSEVRRLGLHRYFHIGPDGERTYYSKVDNTLIRAAVQFSERAVTLEDVHITLADGSEKVLQFEVRFGDNATSPRMPTSPPTGMIQVNLGNNNTRVVDKIDDGVEVLKIRQVKLPSLSEQRSLSAARVTVVDSDAAAATAAGSEPEPEPEPAPFAAGRQAISHDALDAGDAESVLAQMIRAQDTKQRQAATLTAASRAHSKYVDLDDDDTDTPREDDAEAAAAAAAAAGNLTGAGAGAGAGGLGLPPSVAAAEPSTANDPPPPPVPPPPVPDGPPPLPTHPPPTGGATTPPTVDSSGSGTGGGGGGGV